MKSIRARLADERGFTLIELLVVILIIGVLAAIAIPLFLGQTTKAYDSSAKSLAQTAQTAAESYAVENGKGYEGLSPSELHSIQPTIPTSESAAKGGPWLSSASAPSSSEYVLTVIASHTKDEFTITRASSGISHTCVQKTTGTSGCKNGSW